ncbi:MAG: hypothetical protein JNJ56_12575 [Ignavibacteria bacterium]|nr:hypothetical protein [Ignavibacteria bacterium]
MIIPEKIKKYFTYDDRLRTIVSKITGILIIIFNVFSGFMLIYITADFLFGIKNPGALIMFLYFVTGIAAGGIVLKTFIIMFDLILNGIEMEEYSYLRVVLLVSIAFYLFILIIFIFTIFISFISHKI